MRDRQKGFFKGGKMHGYLLLFLSLFFISGCTANKELHQNLSKTGDKKYKVYNSSEKAAVLSHDFLTENPLHDAVRGGDLELVRFLLSQGVDLNQQDEYGYTPLHLAVRLNNLEIVRYLLSKGAVVNTVDNFKDTPLLDSTRNNDTDISRELICHGAERNVCDRHGMSTLNNSSKNNNKFISEMLRADHVEPYCQKELEIDIDRVRGNKLCGNILKGFAANVTVNLEDGNGEFFGDYDAMVDNSSHSWCLGLADKGLKDGTYKVNASGVDYVVNESLSEKSLMIGTDKIAIDDTEPLYDQTPRVCGDIIRGDIEKVFISFEDGDKKYGEYEAVVYVDQKRWCSDMGEKLPYGSYELLAKGYNEQGEMVSAKGDITILEPLNEIEVSVDQYNRTVGNMPRICGEVVKGDVVKLEAVLKKDGEIFGPYSSKIKDGVWCARVLDELPNGKYDIEATGVNSFGKSSTGSSQIRVFVIPGLYEALKNEFEKDFDPWQAELDKDTLTWRFKNPSIMFESARKELKPGFKKILDDFYPRYIKILKKYDKDIKSVVVEGHSSSEHRLGKTEEEKYLLNLELSQSRADEVLEYAKSSSSPVILENIVWILNKFHAQGYSSSNLIYNEDGTENKELSRRVEFRIETLLKD